MAKIYRRHVDADTCVHLDEFAALDSACCWPELMEGQVVGYSPTTNAIVPVTDPVFGDVVTGDLTVCGELKTCQDVSIACDLHVNGDAYVAGTLHYTDTEVINSTADNIILRQNNNTPLSAGQHSGVIINNATATASTAIVTDCTGTVRVGNASATTTTYAYIYLSSSDGKWYSDDTLTTEVTPSGDLTAWSSSDKTDDYTHYTNAVFSVYSVTSTQPIATRDEEANMVICAPLVWDGTNKKAVTTFPLCGCMVLQTCVNDITGCLETEWVDNHPSATTCHYATMACFEADKANIPNDAWVVIDDEYDVVMSEDK